MRHRFHSTCPCFAMFPETFVEKHLAATTFAGVVFDPFCGRKLGKTEIAKRLTETLREGTGRRICLVDGGVTSLVKRTQANTFRGPKASPTDEHDFCFIVG